MRSLLLAVLTLALVLGSVPVSAALPPGGTFIDDDGNPHEGAIEAIAAEGITKGCNPPFVDRYCPAGKVDRESMAAFLRRAMDLPVPPTDYFSDDNGSLFEPDINAIAAAGITTGCRVGEFCPDRILRRDEMAAFLRRALALPDAVQNYFGDDDGSPFEPDINAIAAAEITVGCRVGEFCPGGELLREEMASFLARAFDLIQVTPPPRPALRWSTVVTGLTRPVQAVAPPGEHRLLIAEQDGLVRVFDGSLSANPFLDLTGVVATGGEKGLLSIAIHPDYPADRRLFVWYYGKDNRTHLVEYDITADLLTAASPRTVLSVSQPYSNHNGGFLDFGPDGYLYLGLGDGGSGDDPQGRARDLGSLLGKMIRIDVDGPSPYGIPPDNPYVGKPGLDEIWASGLRNPWRWSFDGDHIFIGDVGQSQREEVDVVTVSPVGYDFGWSRFEGSLCNPNDTDPSCDPSGLTFPVSEYDHSVGRSIVGGIVYRGPTVRSLHAYYLYADTFSGVIRGFRFSNGRPVEAVDLTTRLASTGIVSFGEDGDGELLVVNLFDGAVYRLVGG